MKKGEKDLTKGNIKKQLLTLSLPMLFGMTGIVVFNLADTYFVGKLGIDPLAAISFCFPVIMVINSIALGFGTGTSALISRIFFIEKHDTVRRTASQALVLGIAVVIIFVIVGLLTIDPLFKAIGADEEIMPYIRAYMRIWYFGVPFVVMPMIGNNIVRATGNTFLPGMLMVMSSVVNIVLDPILIFGLGPIPGMGIEGAAWATVIARSTGLVFILAVLIKRSRLLTVKLGSAKDIRTTWKKVSYIAGPATLAMLITPLSMGIITGILSQFGKEAVAAFGVATRVEMFALMVIASLGSVLIIFIGQNAGKDKFDRIFKSLKFSGIFSIGWGLLIYLILLLWGRDIAAIFTDEGEVADIAYRYFLFVAASYGLQGLVMLSSQAFNGINKPIPSAIISATRMFVLFIPLAAIWSNIFGLNGIFAAGLTANTITGIGAYIFIRKTVGKIQSGKLKIEQ